MSEEHAPLGIHAGEIQFVEACLPPLAAGNYQVTMNQTVDEPRQKDPYTAQLAFSVEAPRFTLAPAEIHAVYPPSDQTGRFDNALPHVVFTRRTLPWEREPEVAQAGAGHRPWLAVLLLKEDELAVSENGRTSVLEAKALPIVGEKDEDSLLFPATKDIRGPQLTLTEGEKKRYRQERCLALDLPAELFGQIAPQPGDLPYLAHARQVDTGDKEVFAVNDRGWFSLVMGNRLPEPKKAHRAFLVSMEGMLGCLGKKFDVNVKTVRLAVLCSWRFACEGDNDFKGRVGKLSVDSLRPPARPSAPKHTDDTSEPENIVDRAYARGYTALNHVLRQGEKTVSWYRGPLVPLQHTEPKQLQELVACADALLQYDPDTGIFDVSHAAAWQLGRLLALQNQSFALALNRARAAWRKEAEQRARRRAADARLRRLDRKSEANGRRIDERLVAHFAAGSGRKLLEAIRPAARRYASAAPADVSGHGGSMPGAGTEDLKKALQAGDRGAETLTEVTEWLARLVLLYGVPFDHLIPREEMLPKESLRFFFLDPIWIQCLLQGACSVGNTSHGDTIVDQAMSRWTQPVELESPKTADVLGQVARVRERLRQQWEGVEPPETPEPQRRSAWPLTGFLLRSNVVAGWRGLEIEAYSSAPKDKNQRYPEAKFRLRPLRIEQLSSDVLLAIFDGEVDWLAIRQPREGLHFGLTPEKNFYVKTLRQLGHKDPEQAGKTLADPAIDLTQPGLMRNLSRVVDIKKLADEMKERLTEYGQLEEGKFTSAEFAIQMIDAAGELTCRLSQPKPQ